MTTDRIPFTLGKLPCGHHPACLYRYRGKHGESLKYCMACICEKSGIEDVDTQWKNLKAQEANEPVVEETPEEVEIPVRDSEVIDAVSTIIPAKPKKKAKK